MRITADPDHPFDRLPDDLALALSEAFEPLLKREDDQRRLNALAESIERETEYRYHEGVKRGRRAALQFLGNRFAEMAAKMPNGFGFFGWTKAFLVTGYQCCMTDEHLSTADAFWFQVRTAYERAEKAEREVV